MKPLFFLINSAYAQAQGATAGGGSAISALLPFVLIFGIFYFLVIRPQQKQRKKHVEFLGSLKKGDEVVTSSGIIGTIASINDKTVSIEIAENVKIKVLRGTVSTSAKQACQEAEGCKDKK